MPPSSWRGSSPTWPTGSVVFKHVGSRAYALVTTPKYHVYLAAEVVDLPGDRAAGADGEEERREAKVQK